MTPPGVATGGGAARRVAMALGGVALGACGGGKPAAPAPGAQLARAVIGAIEAARGEKRPWRCAAADGPKLAEEELPAGRRSWKLAGRTLALPQGEGELAIGVIADAGGAAPTTLAALAALGRKLARADLVIALGGMGASQAELEATLGAIAEETACPLVALPGDLEPAAAQAAAVAALRARGRPVIDGRRVGRIELSGATIAAIPGGGAAARLVAGVEGCGYRASDAATALAELAKHPGLRIAASAEAPRIVVDGEPAGELALTAGEGRELDVALHGPVATAATPARRGRRDGAAVALTPGTSDATTRLPGPRRSPSAGLLVVSDGAWRWTPVTSD